MNRLESTALVSLMMLTALTSLEFARAGEQNQSKPATSERPVSEDLLFLLGAWKPLPSQDDTTLEIWTGSGQHGFYRIREHVNQKMGKLYGVQIATFERCGDSLGAFVEEIGDLNGSPKPVRSCFLASHGRAEAAFLYSDQTRETYKLTAKDTLTVSRALPSGSSARTTTYIRISSPNPPSYDLYTGRSQSSSAGINYLSHCRS